MEKKSQHQSSSLIRKTDGEDFSDLNYESGFGNSFSSEAIDGALPRGQNSPLVCPFGLYAEQISGTSFTSPRKLNQRRSLSRLDNCFISYSYLKKKSFFIWRKKNNLCLCYVIASSIHVAEWFCCFFYFFYFEQLVIQNKTFCNTWTV